MQWLPITLLTLTGYNFTFWVLIGVLRWASETMTAYLNPPVEDTSEAPTFLRKHDIAPHEVAVILAAHNEEIALPATLTALKKNLPADNIYIGSDASTDRTVAVAKEYGCLVVDLKPNRGKAKVLKYLLDEFDVLRHYKAVLIMDAEVIVSDHYLEKILPYFDDPEVVAFVSHSISRWQQHWLPRWSMYFTAYRIRLWRLLYYGLRYGQTWKYTSVTPIVPGGSSVYRASALKHIEIDTPGLIIEDFHMTFQIHHKRLGRIASHPSAYIIDQEPYNLRDYYQQVYRWFLGFWQTFMLHGYWPSFFWYTNFLFLLEMFFYSLFVLAVPIILLIFLFTGLDTIPILLFHLPSLSFREVNLTVPQLLIGYLLIDYAITMGVTWIEGKPAMFLYGLGFVFLRIVDTFAFLWTLPVALLTRSSGTWTSPVRR